MFLQRKAVYNLIQLNLGRINKGELKIDNLQPWQKENYREKTNEELFGGLHELGLNLTIQDFEGYSKNFETPEEILDCLAKQKPALEQDRIFLNLFELWRRLCPEKRSISIFCDELDFQMARHDLGQPSEIADALAYLQQLLDENVDKGMPPLEAFQLIQVFCASHIESFLFDYILDEVEMGNHLYALELLEGFKRYMKDREGFDYLQARAEILEHPEEGYDHLEKLILKINSDTNLDLVEEMLFFLANTGNHSLFYTLAKKALSHLKTEEDFRGFLEACYSHYDYLELKQPSLAIAELFHSRSEIPCDAPLFSEDVAIKEIREILNHRLHFANE